MKATLRMQCRACPRSFEVFLPTLTACELLFAWEISKFSPFAMVISGLFDLCERAPTMTQKSSHGNLELEPGASWGRTSGLLWFAFLILAKARGRMWQDHHDTLQLTQGSSTFSCTHSWLTASWVLQWDSHSQVLFESLTLDTLVSAYIRTGCCNAKSRKELC